MLKISSWSAASGALILQISLIHMHKETFLKWFWKGEKNSLNRNVQHSWSLRPKDCITSGQSRTLAFLNPGSCVWQQ